MFGQFHVAPCVSHRLAASQAPRTVEALRDLRLLRSLQAHMHVTPGGGLRQLFRPHRGHSAGRINDVHTAEVRDAVIENQQLAMVAVVQDAQR